MGRTRRGWEDNIKILYISFLYRNVNYDFMFTQNIFHTSSSMNYSYCVTEDCLLCVSKTWLQHVSVFGKKHIVNKSPIYLINNP